MDTACSLKHPCFLEQMWKKYNVPLISFQTAPNPAGEWIPLKIWIPAMSYHSTDKGLSDLIFSLSFSTSFLSFTGFPAECLWYGEKKKKHLQKRLIFKSLSIHFLWFLLHALSQIFFYKVSLIFHPSWWLIKLFGNYAILNRWFLHDLAIMLIGSTCLIFSFFHHLTRSLFFFFFYNEVSIHLKRSKW